MTEIDLGALSTSDHGYTVDDEDEDEPVLLDRDGKPVETWRQDYPYAEKMPLIPNVNTRPPATSGVALGPGP